MKLLPIVLLLVAVGSLTSQEGADAEEMVALQFEPGGTPLESFLDFVELELGMPVHYKKEEVNGIRISLRAVTIPRTDLRKLIESILYAYGMLLTPRGEVMELLSLDRNIASGSRLKAQSEYVPIDQLREYEGRYVVLTTVFPLESIDVQSATNVVQQYFAHPIFESIRTDGNSLVMTGLPQSLIKTVRVVEELERAAGNASHPFHTRLTAVEQRMVSLEKAFALLDED